MVLVDHNDWAFLVPQIPDLELVLILVVECHCYLGKHTLAPGDTNILMRDSVSVLVEGEDGLIDLDIPQGDQTVITRRCHDMSNLLIPRYCCDIGSHMGIFLTDFEDVWIFAQSLADVHNQNFSGTKPKKMGLKGIPLGTNNRVVKDGILLIGRLNFICSLRSYYLRRVPESDSSIFHSSKY